MSRRFARRQTKAQARAAAITRLRDCAIAVKDYGESKYPNLAIAIRSCRSLDIDYSDMSGHSGIPEDILRIVERRH